MAQIVKILNEGSETWNLDGTCESAEVPVLILNPTGKLAAINAARDAIKSARPTIGGLPLTKIRFDGYDSDGNITVVAVYEKSDGGGSSGGDENAAPTVNFDCSAGTKHVTMPIAQTCVYPADDPDAAKIQIGWNGKFGPEAEAAGVDVSIGELRETYTKELSINKVTNADWKKTIARLVGKVNSGDFKGWSAGEVMFLGASYAAPLKGATKVTVSFNFAIRPNESSAKVGNISVGDVKGFEYLWAIQSDKIENGKRVPDLKKIYKAQVCESADFGGIGV